MIRKYLVFICLAAFEYQSCCADTGETDDWRRKGFYRPRRNYPNDNNSFRSNQNFQSQITFGQNSQNSEKQNPLDINYNQNSKTQSVFGSYNRPQNSFGTASQNFKTLEPSKTTFQQTTFGTSYRSQNQHSSSFTNTQNSQNAFSRNGQASFKNGYSHTPSNQNSFSSRASQNSFAVFSQNPLENNNGQNSFVSNFGDRQNTQKQNVFEISYNHNNQNTFGRLGHTQSSLGNSFQNQNISRINSNFGSNSAFKQNDNYRAPDYLPPKRFMAPEYLPPEKPRTTTFPPYVPFRTTTTRRPFITTTTTRKPIFTTSTTRRPFYTTTTTKRPYFTITTTKRPFYTTTTTKRTFFTTTTTKRPTKYPEPSPAMATPVPPEPEDDGNDITPDLMKSRNVTGQVLPAIAMEVPPEPEDGGDKIIDEFPSTSTTPSTTTSTTPSTTTTTTSTTRTTPPPTTTTTTTTIPPPTTTTTTPPPTTTTTTTTIPPPTTTTTSTSTTTPPPTTTTTTTTIPPPTTTTTSTTTTTPPPTTTIPPTTTSTTPPTTTSTTQPTTTTTTLSTTTSTTPPTTTSTPPPMITTSTFSTTTPNPNRNLIEEVSTTTPKPEISSRTTSTPVISSTEPFKAPEYLPPLKVPPSPAIANIVPPEPECDPLDPSTYPFSIDHRSLGSNPCEPPTTTTTIKPPFRGPLYLPPEPKTRVGRSSNSTLKLADLEGTPRPVWYAGIYKKTTNPYKPICGGSIVREDIVISAAHCFWDDAVGKQRAELFAVAARKIYKPWTDTMDKRAQKSDVLDIKIPPRFLGAKTSFQEDLAILKLATPFTYNIGLGPICVDFDDDFDRQQMKTGHLGTIAGWGYTDAKGTQAVRLLWLELPYVEIEKCIRDSDDSFLKYITCDKVCAGENDTGKALCRGDSGGGLAFWQGEPGHATPYLRGIASTSPTANAECNVYAYASFTHVRAHRTFLKDHVPDIENCRFWGYLHAFIAK